MAKHKYRISSEEDASRYGGEVGEVKDIDIPAHEVKAVVAAGWVEPLEEKAKEANK